MKISAMILATLAATLAVIPVSVTSDETFVGQVANLEDEAALASSPYHSLRGLAKKKCTSGTKMCYRYFIFKCNLNGGWEMSILRCG
jgi:hypothetical protein